MKSDVKQILASLAAVILGFMAIFALSNFLEKTRPPSAENADDESLVMKGAKLKGYALGFEGLLADWYWMKSLQYIGDKLAQSNLETINLENLRPLNPRLLYPYLNNATDLDPQFTAAYSYGAIVLPAIDEEQAIKIIEKGIANNPKEWRFHQYLGYIYWRLGEYEKAAQTYSEGAEIEGAPIFMRMMAAKMKSEGGNRETARFIYSQMYEQAQEEQTKRNAELRLLELDSLDERDAIRAALQNFKEKNKRCADNWQEILPILRTVKLPNNKDFRLDKANNLVDPTDAPYVLDKKTCDVQLDVKNTKIPLR